MRARISSEWNASKLMDSYMPHTPHPSAISGILYIIYTVRPLYATPRWMVEPCEFVELLAAKGSTEGGRGEGQREKMQKDVIKLYVVPVLTFVLLDTKRGACSYIVSAVAADMPTSSITVPGKCHPYSSVRHRIKLGSFRRFANNSKTKAALSACMCGIVPNVWAMCMRIRK